MSSSASFVDLPTLEAIRAVRARRKAEDGRKGLMEHQSEMRARWESLHRFIEEH